MTYAGQQGFAHSVSERERRLLLRQQEIERELAQIRYQRSVCDACLSSEGRRPKLGMLLSAHVLSKADKLDISQFQQCARMRVVASFDVPDLAGICAQEWYVGQATLKGSVLDNMDEAMGIALAEGWAVKGTLEECAAFFGLEHLAQSVEAYNALCAAGKDDQFYKEAYLLKPLSGNTYYVVESMPSIWGTFAGVKTDDSCRALTAKQEPIAGLYVAGVDNGSLYASPYYENEGAALGTAFTSGGVAGKCMAAYIKG